MAPPTDSPATGAMFVRYYGPLIEALKTLGGSGTIKEVVAQIARDLDIPANVQDEMLSSGVSKFQNQIQWARLYLVREGLLTNTKRGVWALTEAGMNAHLSLEDAQQIFKRQSEIFRKRRQQLNEDHAQASIAGTPSALPLTAVDSESPDEGYEGGVNDGSSFGSYREEVIALLKILPPDGFERFCQGLLREAGFTEVKVTGKSGDGGIDGYGTLEVNPLVSFKVLFQCKRYKELVGPNYVRDFRGAMQGRADKGIILTTGTFSQGAKQEANRDGAPPIELIDAQRLVDLMEQFEFGLQPVQTYQLNQQFFKDY